MWQNPFEYHRQRVCSERTTYYSVSPLLLSYSSIFPILSLSFFFFPLLLMLWHVHVISVSWHAHVTFWELSRYQGQKKWWKSLEPKLWGSKYNYELIKIIVSSSLSKYNQVWSCLILIMIIKSLQCSPVLSTKCESLLQHLVFPWTAPRTHPKMETLAFLGDGLTHIKFWSQMRLFIGPQIKFSNRKGWRGAKQQRSGGMKRALKCR